MKLYNYKHKLSIHLKKVIFVFLMFCGCIFIYSNISRAELEKEFNSVIDNDTMFNCKEESSDKRDFLYSSFYEETTLASSTHSRKRKSSQQNENSPLDSSKNSNELPTIYFVTPTYTRREQMAELTRLAQTLLNVPKLHWILADDNDVCNKNLDILLDRFGIPYTHLASPMPKSYRNPKKSIPRGVANRRAALLWIKNNNIKEGVLYFGDDDNTFDLRLFSEIRYTNKVSMFPVGLIGDFAVSSPVVKDGKVIGFFDSWPAKRQWPVDMAGFAVNLAYLAKFPNATMPYKAGFEEDEFLKSIKLKIEDIEPKANNCTEVLVWHTQTTKTKAPQIKISSGFLDENKSNLKSLLDRLDKMNVNHVSSSAGVKATITKDGKTKTISSWFR